MVHQILRLTVFLLMIVIIYIGINFGTENNEFLTLKFWGRETQPLRIWFLVFSSMVIGAIMIVLFLLPELVRLTYETTRHKRKIKQLLLKLDEQNTENEYEPQ